MTRPEDPDDYSIETHPDLIDPEWRKHAELDAWLGAKKELKKKRRRERRARSAGHGAGYGTAAPSRWPGIAALIGLVVLVAAAVTVHEVRGPGVNETSIEYQVGSG
ncbi:MULTISPECIES: hypothetical protein [Amycolatopsis]|uniref:Uncharacterized protein n=2 Tax=Amycolatopsis TaxID=1813 RepID=A0A2A9FHD0_9PSEU|nr:MULTISPECIES: hypothetical protein [Amycolatopsis]PFG50323.1 hypothetical protein ATK36_5545 [Amycolatopsis sulphurea]RJQ86399.1 hypothetical protein D5S19_11465 [Amycolatopsis panacis]